jgi:HPt (histidine-containing phosphotransfer) domain-containing protein
VAKELKALRLAEAAEDYATIQRIGHNLHGSGGSFGFPMITEFGNQMEQAAKDRAMERIRGTIVQLDMYVERVTAGNH